MPKPKTEKGAGAPAAEPTPILSPAEPAPEPNPPTPPADPVEPGDPPPEDASPPEPEPAPEPVKGRDDPLLASVFRDYDEGLGIKRVDDDPEPEPEPEEPPATPEPEPTPDPAPAPATKRKKVRILDPVIDAPAPPTAPAVPHGTQQPLASPPAPDADVAYRAALSEEQKEELLDYEWAERNMPDRYQGHQRKLLDFYKKYDQFLAKSKDDPDRTFDEKDQEFMSWMQANKPRFGMADAKKIQAGRIREEATRDAHTQIQPELETLKRRQHELEVTPRINNSVQQFEEGVHDLLADAAAGINPKAPPEETAAVTAIAAAAELMRTDPAKAAEEYPMETQMIGITKNRYNNLARTYVQFAHKVLQYDRTNREHVEVFDFVNREGEHFATNGGKARVQNGKKFMPRMKFAEFLQANPSEAAAYHESQKTGNSESATAWTFSHRNILEIMAFQSKKELNQAVLTMRKQIEGYGYKAKEKASATPPPNTPPITPINPPRAKTSAAPGAAAVPANNNEPTPSEGLNVRSYYPKTF